MPAGQGKDAERFAAAAESRTPLGATDDADLARELEIVAMLRSRGAAFAPDAETKARAKQRLMAVLAAEQGGPRQAPRPAAAPPAAAELTAPLGRLVEHEDVDATAETTLMERITADAGSDSDSDSGSDSGTVVAPIPLNGGGRAGRKARHSIGGRAKRSAPAGFRGRVVFVGAAASAVLLAIASGGVLASSDSLPGDTLYPVKRVAESAGLALTFDDADRARRHLEMAATRLSEVEQLTQNTQSAPAPEVFTTAMDDFDTATNEGSQLLLSAAEANKGGTAADDLHKWATEQSDRLTELEPALPAAADADASRELLERLLGQTAGLEGGDNASRRTAGESTAESGSEDAGEAATSTPDKEGSSDGRETDKPSRTPDDTTERENPQLLPDLLPDSNQGEDEKPSGTADNDEDNSSSSESDSGDGGDGNVGVPLPLLPPVTLPPLLPGLPGITIG
jgi:hypothetical protein